MAINDELLGFVRKALARGQSRGDVERILLNTGWSRDQVSTALTAFADIPFPIPVPRPRPYLSARDAFIYLLLFGTLYVSAFNLEASCSTSSTVRFLIRPRSLGMRNTYANRYAGHSPH